MTLKEAFRYQNFIERVMLIAKNSAKQDDVLLKTKKSHLRSKAHENAPDETEEVKPTVEYEARHVFELMLKLVDERERLTSAITRAKCALNHAPDSAVDIDTLTETNKFRQMAANAMRAAISSVKPGETVERGTAYCFNAEGNQTPYQYDVIVTTEALFDKADAQATIHRLLADSDKASAVIDAALAEDVVNYFAPWPVSATFDEIMDTVVNREVEAETENDAGADPSDE